MFLVEPIYQNAHSFRTFSNLLEALQYEACSIKLDKWRIFELLMLVKVEVNVESLFEHLFNYTV